MKSNTLPNINKKFSSLSLEEIATMLDSGELDNAKNLRLSHNQFVHIPSTLLEKLIEKGVLYME